MFQTSTVSGTIGLGAEPSPNTPSHFMSDG
jgi:hypothetical protein